MALYLLYGVCMEKYFRLKERVLLDISKAFSKVSTLPSDVLKDTVNSLSTLEHIKRIGIYMLGTKDEINLEYGYNMNSKFSKPIKKGQGVIGSIFKDGYPVVIKDLTNESYFLNLLGRDAKDLQDSIFIGVPIKHDNKVLGVISVDLSKQQMKQDKIAIDDFLQFLIILSNLIGSYAEAYYNIKKKEESMSEEIAFLKKELSKSVIKEGFIGVSRIYEKIIEQALKIANLDVTVMIRGESGTGKTSLAKFIHFNSVRKDNPFVEVNCAAIPETLLEAELFGYEKGAFSGAYTTKKGKIEQAEGGTLFLDEIGDMPLSMQAKLLRFLQSKEFEKIGSTKTQKANVRIIVATNKDLEKMVKDRLFREDLYYRISVYSIYIPPLRERKEDIPILIEYFIKNLKIKLNKDIKIDKATVDIMIACDWQGNIRELESCLTRAAIMSNSNIIKPEDLSCVGGLFCPTKVINKTNVKALEHSLEHKQEHVKAEFSEKPKTVEDEEKEKIIQALEKTGYVQAKAARLLGMTVRQLNYRISKYNIEIKKL